MFGNVQEDLKVFELITNLLCMYGEMFESVRLNFKVWLCKKGHISPHHLN